MYIIEANPRASRTVPFVAKAVGHPLATYASLLMAGQTLKDINFTEEPTLNHVAVKEAVLPFDKFQGGFSHLIVCLTLACSELCSRMASLSMYKYCHALYPAAVPGICLGRVTISDHV